MKKFFIILSIIFFIPLICFPLYAEGTELLDLNEISTSDIYEIIDSKEKLLEFLKQKDISKDTYSISNRRFIIKGTIELDSDELPSEPLNIYGSEIIGESATIIINSKNGILSHGIFGDIKELEKPDNSKEYGFSHIKDLNFIFNGDVANYTFANNLEGAVHEYIDTVNTIENINIKVNGSVIPYNGKQNVSGFVINCTGFDLKDIHVHVTENIGIDKVFKDFIGVQGLFTDSDDNGKPTRVEDSSVKIDGSLIAKGKYALAGGVSVNSSGVIANNITSDINKIDVQSTGKYADWCSASIGFLNKSTSNIISENGFGSVNITVNDWVNNDIVIEFRSSLRSNQYGKTENVKKSDLTNVGPEFESPISDLLPKRGTIKSSVVNNSNFSVNTTNINSNTGAKFIGAAYQMAGSNNSITVIDSINLKARDKSLICGYGGFNENGNNINIDINIIDVSMDLIPTSGARPQLFIIGSTVNDYGTKDSNLNINNIDIKADDARVYLAGWSNVSNSGENNNINISDIKISDTLINNISGYSMLLTNKDQKQPKDIFSNINVVLGNIYSSNNQLENRISGFSNRIQENSSNIKNIKIYLNDIFLNNGSDNLNTQIAGVSTDNSQKYTTIENSAALFSGDIIADSVNKEGSFSGFVNINNGTIKNSSVQILGNMSFNKITDTENPIMNISGFSNTNNNILENNTALILGSMESNINNNHNSLFSYSGAEDKVVFENNSIYIKDFENSIFNKNDVRFIKNANSNQKIINNTLLLDKDSKIHKDNFISGFDNLNSNFFVEVSEGNRSAYEYSNNNLNSENILGKIKIFPRDFQNDYWKSHLLSTDNFNYPDFKYVIENKDNISLDNFGPDIEISTSPFDIASINGINNRHMAIIGDNITYDILGIDAGKILFHNVEFVPNGGIFDDLSTENKIISVENGLTTDSQLITKEGYIFKGWELADKSTFDFNTEITDNISLYAIWEKITTPVEPNEDKPMENNSTSKKRKKYNLIEVDKKEINTLHHKAYLKGYEDNTIRPEGNITRAEVATIFSRLITDDALLNNTDLTYSDIEKSDWFNKYIYFVTTNKIMEGYENNIFKPNEFITRGEFATVVSRFKKLSPSKSSLTDVNNHWSEKHIGAVENKNWINGYPDGSFKPEKYISREEVSTIINKMEDRKVNEDGINNLNIINFNDLNKNSWSYYDMVEASNSHNYERKELIDFENWISLFK